MALSANPILAAVFGVLAAAGLLLAADGNRRRVRDTSPLPAISTATMRRVSVAVVAGLLAWIAFGWPILGAYTVAGILLLPKVLVQGRRARARTDRIEAIGTWTESVRDSLSQASGIQQAILAACARPPEAIAQDVAVLVAALQHQRLPLHQALARFQECLDDPIADTVIAQLIIAGDAASGRVAAMLSAIAETARDHVGLRLEIDADRAPVRSELRIIVGVTIAMAAGLRFLRPTFLAPYHSLTGQLVLAVAGGLIAAGMAWIVGLQRGGDPARVLFTGTAGRRVEAAR